LAVGFALDGDSEGDQEGDVDGIEYVGSKDGFIVGLGVVGEDVGATEGWVLGSTEGVLEGLTEGQTEGFIDGCALG